MAQYQEHTFSPQQWSPQNLSLQPQYHSGEMSGSFTQGSGNLEYGFQSPFAENHYQAPTFNPQLWKHGHYAGKKGSNQYGQSTGFQALSNGFQNSLINHSYSAGSQVNHYGNQGNYNSSQSSYGGAEGRSSYHGHNQKYQPRQQYQVKKPGAASSASSGASA